ncbi:MAG: acyl-CoA reductase [Chitinophagaceae bacterium]
MHLQQRIDLLARTGAYILANNDEWQATVEKASLHNGWFIPEFIHTASTAIAEQMLEAGKLQAWAEQYNIPAENKQPGNVGIVMAGNIPLVGFHDFLCVFMAGHHQTIKPSSKDDVLLRHLIQKMIEWEPAMAEYVSFAEMLKNRDAYIATGSNNTARYFDYYFGRFPHIVRRNRTSVAILTGNETIQNLEKLADDVYLYFGLGCRNVTKIYVPQDYDFLPLLETFKKYNYLADHSKYKNNYDYVLATLIINKHYYMTNGSIVLFESKPVFSPISQLNYEFYTDKSEVLATLQNNEDIQAIAGKDHIPFGQAQQPTLTDYADGVDTMEFLVKL